jgi:hypothetical protein
VFLALYFNLWCLLFPVERLNITSFHGMLVCKDSASASVVSKFFKTAGIIVIAIGRRLFRWRLPSHFALRLTVEE